MKGMTNMTRRRLFGLLTGWMISLALGTTTAQALDRQAASAFVDQLTREAVMSLSTPDLSRQERAQAVRDLVTRYSNMEQMAEELLGRTWTSASPEERTRFQERLADYVVALCTGMVKDVPAEREFVVAGTDLRGDRILVHSLLSTDDEAPTAVDWSVGATADGQLFLADVSAQGVSLVRMMRSDFRAVLFANAGRLDALLVTMKKKIEVAFN